MEARAETGILVGREPQLRALEQRLADVTRGNGGIVVLTGEPGIGKTRLLQAALRHARVSGLTTAFSANFRHARTPFGPWIDVIRTLSGSVRELTPTLAPDKNLFERVIGASDGPQQDGFNRRRLFVIIMEAFSRAAARMPIVLGIDDAQWMDSESLELLEFIAARIGTMRLAIVLSTRTEDGDDPPLVSLQVLERFPVVRTIALPPLETDAVRELVAAITPATRRIARDTLDEICRRSDGNPLFVGELVRDALTGSGTTRLPASIQMSAIRRLGSLNAVQMHIVETASVLGRDFSLPNLARAAATSRSVALGAIRAARDAGILVENDTNPEMFAFRHELVRSSVYDRMLAAERMDLHRTIAKLFESSENPIQASLLAYHWLHAGETERTARYCELAGDDAVRVHAHATASGQYRRALESGVLKREDRARLAEKAGRAFDFAGGSVVATQYLHQAAAAYRELGDAEHALAVELAFARAAHRAGLADEMLTACARVLAAAPAGPLTFAAQSLLAMYYAHRNDVTEARVHLEAADAIPGPHDPRDELSLEWARAVAAVFSNDDAWIDSAHRALSIAETCNDASLLTFTLMNFAIIARERGRETEAGDALGRTIALADANGLGFAAAYARCEKIASLHGAGQLQASHRLLLETAALHTEATIVRIFTACAGIALLADMDRMEDLPALRDPNLLEDAFATGEGQHFGPLAAAHAHAALLSNEPEIAAALGNRAIAGMTSTAYASAAVVTFARCVTDDNLEQVDALIRVLPSAGVPRLHHLLAQAIVASRRGETEHARRLAAVLIDTAHRAASPLVEAQALELAGRRSDALAIYERIGAAAHIRRMAPRKSRELTAREREIANLIASGMSNRDIATRLIVSERTVEHHAAALYGKLGVKRRAEFIASRTRPVNHSG